MQRLRGLSVLFVCLLVSSGCQKAPPSGTLSYQLDLTLPVNGSSSHSPKLTIHGQDYSHPAGTKRTVMIDAAGDHPIVEIEYSYWPKSYTNIIRKRQVTLERGQVTVVDMTSEDPAFPDLIKPIFVPTPSEVVTAMGKMAKITPEDVVYDIGCGEGMMVLQAVREYGARKGVGIDIDERLVRRCREHAAEQGLGSKVEFRVGNALEIKDYSEASVVLLYLGEDLNAAIKPALRKSLKPGARVVSHRFLMGKDWPPDESITIQARNNLGAPEEFKLHLWTIK